MTDHLKFKNTMDYGPVLLRHGEPGTSNIVIQIMVRVQWRPRIEMIIDMLFELIATKL